METWIRECEFEKLPMPEGDVTIEGGFDEFERVDIREEDEITTHIFKTTKRTPLFEIEIRWEVDPESEDMDDDELKEGARSQIRAEGSYQVAHYLRSMDMIPLQGLFYDGVVISFEGPDDDDSEQSELPSDESES